jgi:hypothetical protein
MTDHPAAGLAQGLDGYLHAVAEAIGVPLDGSSYEVSDTVTAYLALTRRWSRRPGRDLMLVWDETGGWSIAIETDPGEPPEVIARWSGTDPVPAPEAVARFVTQALSGGPAEGRPANVVAAPNRARLAERLMAYA